MVSDKANSKHMSISIKHGHWTFISETLDWKKIWKPFTNIALSIPFLNVATKRYRIEDSIRTEGSFQFQFRHQSYKYVYKTSYDTIDKRKIYLHSTLSILPFFDSDNLNIMCDKNIINFSHILVGYNFSLKDIINVVKSLDKEHSLGQNVIKFRKDAHILLPDVVQCLSWVTVSQCHSPQNMRDMSQSPCHEN